MQVCVCVRLAAAMNSLTFAQACSRSPSSSASTPSSHLLCKSANLLHCSNCHESPGLPLLSSLSVTIFSKPSWTVPPVQIHTAGAEDSSIKIEHCISACQRTWTTVWCTSHLLIPLSLSLSLSLSWAGRHCGRHRLCQLVFLSLPPVAAWPEVEYACLSVTKNRTRKPLDSTYM